MHKQHNIKTIFKKYNLEYFIFISPMVILFSVFFIIPLFESIYYSFTNWRGVTTQAEFIGLRNFVYIFTRDKDFIRSFVFTFKYTSITTISTNVISILLASVLSSRILFEKKLRIAFFVPNAIGLVLVGIIWNFILGPFAHELATNTGISFFGSPWLTDSTLALISVSFAALWQSVGWYTLIYIAGFEGISVEYTEAAKIEGCNAFKEFLYIKLPLIVPSITICIFLTLTNGFKVFDILFTMTKGGPGKATESVIMNIYNTSFSAFLYGYGLAKSLLLVIVIGFFGILQVSYTKKMEVEH